MLLGPLVNSSVKLRAVLPATTLFFAYEIFGIDEAHILKEHQAQKPITTQKQFWVIEAQNLTTEAQNALLKMLEEPVSGHHFFFLVPTAELLLPTLLSRCEIITAAPIEKLNGKNSAAAFAAAGAEKRLQLIQAILTESESAPILARAAGRELLEALEKVWQEKMPLAKAAAALQELERGRQYLLDRAAAPRLILEHLALVLPPDDATIKP